MIGNRWPHKPPLGYELDGEHLLSVGLKGFYALNEGSGPILGDATGNLPLAISAGTTTAWASGETRGLSATGGNAGAIATVPSGLQLNWPISFAIGFRFLGTPTANANILGLLYTNTSTNPYNVWSLANYTSLDIQLTYNNGGTLVQDVVETLSIGVDYVLSATVAANSQGVYLNGSRVYSASTAISGPTYGAFPTLAIGANPQVTTRNPELLCYWAAWWSRILQPSEHAALAVNPWQVFEPKRTLATSTLIGSIAHAYTLTGPSSGFTGEASSNFTLATNLSSTDTITFSDGSPGGHPGTFTPSSLPYSGSYAPQTFTYSPFSGYTGPLTITLTSADGYTINGSPYAFTSKVTAVNYTLTGPSTATAGQPSTNFTLTPGGSISYTESVSLSDGAGGVFRNSGGTVVTSLNFTDSSGAAQSFTYTPATAGTKTITLVSSDGGSISGEPATLTASAVGLTLSAPSPSSGVVLVASANFTLTPAEATNDTITFSDGGKGGTFTPTSLTFTTASTAPQTFTYTPAIVAPSLTITAISANGGTITDNGETYASLGNPGSLAITNTAMFAPASFTGFDGVASATFAIQVQISGNAGSTSANKTTIVGWASGNPLVTYEPSTSSLYLSLYNASGSSLTATLAVQFGLGYSIVISYANGAQTIYVNGVPFATGTLSGDTAAYTTPQIGGAPGSGTTTMDHQVANAAFWSGYAFDQADVTSLGSGANPLEVHAGSLAAYWPLEGGTLTDATQAGDLALADGSGNGHTLTLVSGGSYAGADYAAAISPAAPVTTTAYATKSGKLATFLANGVIPASNGYYANPAITAVTGTPTVTWNGHTVALGPATWYSTALDYPFVQYRMHCGSVERLTIEDGGENFNTASTISVTIATSNGVGTAPTVVSPITEAITLATGVTGYTITNAGSGFTPNSTVTVTVGATPGLSLMATSPSSALAYATTNSSGEISAILPITNDVFGFGSGYLATPVVTITGGGGTGATAIAIVSGGAITGYTITNAGAGYTSTPTVTVTGGGGSNATATATVSGEAVTAITVGVEGTGYASPPAVTIGGSGGATAVAQVSNYIYSILLATGGSGMTALPTITINDTGGGSGATAVAVMSGAAEGDTLTYAASANWFTTTVGPAPAASGAAMGNYSGQLEPAFTTTPTMLFGVNLGANPSSYGSSNSTVKNRLLHSGTDAWNVWGTATAINSFDSNDYPVSWTGGSPGAGGVQQPIEHPSGSNAIDSQGIPSPSGTYTVIYNDPGGEASPVWTVAIGFQGGSTTGLNGTPGVSWSGNTCTMTFDIVFKPGYSGSTELWLNLSNATGTWSNTVGGVTLLPNPQVFFPSIVPGAAAPTVGQGPYATDANVLAALQPHPWAAPACIRTMDVNAAFGGFSNVISPADLAWFDHAATWGTNNQTLLGSTNFNENPGYARVLIPVAAVRVFNTNPASETYAWSSTRVYGPQSWFTASGLTDSSYAAEYGSTWESVPYIQLPANDMGQFLWPPNGPQGSSSEQVVMELVFGQPHGLTTGYLMIVEPPFSIATATLAAPTVSGGVIATGALIVSNGGSGYAPNATAAALVITDVGVGTGATATPNLSGGGVASITVGLGGMGYTLPPTVTITSGGGTGATATAAVSGGAVTGITVTNAGTGYNFPSDPPIVTISGGGSGATGYYTTNAAGQVTTAVITAGGSGYVTPSISTMTPVVIPSSGNFNLNIDDGYATVWVTGPLTIVLAYAASGAPTLTNTPQTPAPAITAVNWVLNVGIPIGTANSPYQYTYALCSELGSSPWINFGMAMTDATVALLGTWAAQYYTGTNPIYLELSNEIPGDTAQSQPWFNSLGYLGTSPYLGDIDLFGFDLTSTPLYDLNVGARCLWLPHLASVFEAAYQAGGGLAKIVPVHGGWYGSSAFAQEVVTACNMMGIDLTKAAICIAPYLDVDLNNNIADLDTLIVNAYQPAATTSNGSPGNWPVSALCDFIRHSILYNPGCQESFQQHYNYLHASTTGVPQLVCYESAIQQVIPGSGSVAMHPYAGPLAHDITSHPDWADVIWTFGLALQQGCPTIAGSGAALANYFQCFGIYGIFDNNWYLSYGPCHAPGAGTDNQFATPQGGLATAPVATITVTGAGTGYGTAPTVTISGGGGSGATATAALSGSGVASITVTNNGTGYLTAPTVTLTGGGGTGATATATLALGYNHSYLAVNQAVGLGAMQSWWIATAQPGPTITATTPASSATLVSIASPVVATFGEAIQPSTLDFTIAPTEGGSNIAGTVLLDPTETIATFIPSRSNGFANGTKYTGSIQATDQDGVPMLEPYTWSWTTTYAPPTGAGVIPGIGYQFNKPIVATNMVISVVISASEATVSGTTSYNPETYLATFTPASPFAVGTKYIATISGATASDGTAMTPVTFVFTPGPSKAGGSWFAGLGKSTVSA
jgi:hypothetical protein